MNAAELDRVEQRARELALVAEGVMDAGFESLGRRSRVAADDLLPVLDELRAERSARCTLQEQRDGALEILAAHAGAALTDDQEGGRR